MASSLAIIWRHMFTSALLQPYVTRGFLRSWIRVCWYFRNPVSELSISNINKRKNCFEKLLNRVQQNTSKQQSPTLRHERIARKMFVLCSFPNETWWSYQCFLNTAAITLIAVIISLELWYCCITSEWN